MSQEEQKRLGEKEKKTFSDSLTSFFVKFRFVILGFIVSLIVAVVVVSVISYFTEKSVKMGLSEIDTITSEFAVLKVSESSDSAKEDELIARAQAVVDKRNPTIVTVRAQMIIAEIQYSKKNYEAARTAWLAAAEADKKSYTYGLCNYQCGIASEELKDFDNAVLYLKKASEAENFSNVPRALFNIGRIEETRGNADKAAESYQKLVADYPSNQWSSLAKSRLITLSIEGKIN
ncbi:MAG: tetratricopeptide repeat protein [Treponema sp.]|jgi:tetratricopeptide (TPR) repeat protein|nr:tetratricopeptide repeat protein [Treponema sp.]